MRAIIEFLKLIAKRLDEDHYVVLDYEYDEETSEETPYEYFDSNALQMDIEECIQDNTP